MEQLVETRTRNYVYIFTDTHGNIFKIEHDTIKEINYLEIERLELSINLRITFDYRFKIYNPEEIDEVGFLNLYRFNSCSNISEKMKYLKEMIKYSDDHNKYSNGKHTTELILDDDTNINYNKLTSFYHYGGCAISFLGDGVHIPRTYQMLVKYNPERYSCMIIYDYPKNNKTVYNITIRHTIDDILSCLSGDLIVQLLNA
jgi:hypothetical protein